MTLCSHASSKNALHVKNLVGGVTLPSHANSKITVHVVGGMTSGGGSSMMIGGAEGTLSKVTHSAQKQLFAFIFQLSGGALVATSCFALQVPDV